MKSGQYLAIFNEVLKGMQKDVVLNRTSKGAFILELFKHLQASSTSSILIATQICSQLETQCLSKQHVSCKGADNVMKHFHKLRFSEELKKSWVAYVQRMDVPQHLQQYTSQSLQLILDRMLKVLILRCSTVAQSQCSSVPGDASLSEREENVIRYMSGYVAVKLLKRFKRKSLKKEKWVYFVRVLEGMRAENQPECGDTIEEYSEAWAEHIDRRGLYHVKSEVC